MDTGSSPFLKLKSVTSQTLVHDEELPNIGKSTLEGHRVCAMEKLYFDNKV